MSARSFFISAALALVACGGEATTTGPADASTKPASTTAKPSTPSASPVPTQAGLEPSPANVGKLLEGGQSLKALPSRPVDSGKGFDPELRTKLAPQSPAKNP